MQVAAAKASATVFVRALLLGLLWGIVAATVFGGIAMALATPTLTRSVQQALRIILETAVWTAMTASILALFPIGPVAGLIAWQTYRRGILAGWVYALTGALAALCAPLFLLWLSV